MALVGNKCDLPSNKIKVLDSNAFMLANKYNMVHAEVSAKTGEGIATLFEQIAEKVYEIES